MTLDVSKVSFKGNEEQRSNGSNPILPSVLLGGAAGGGSYYGLTTPPTEDTFVKRIKDGTLKTDDLNDAQKTKVADLKAELDKTPATTTTDATTPAPVAGENKALTDAQNEATEAARKLRHQQEIANLELEQTKKMQQVYQASEDVITPTKTTVPKKQLTAKKIELEELRTILEKKAKNPNLDQADISNKLKKVNADIREINSQIFTPDELSKANVEDLKKTATEDAKKLLEEQKTANTALGEATTAKTKADTALKKLQAELKRETDTAKQTELTTKIATAEKEVAQATESLAETTHKHKLITRKVKVANSIVEGLQNNTLGSKLTTQKAVASLDDNAKAIGTAFTEVAEDGKLNKALNSALEKVDSLSHNSTEAAAKATRLAEARNKILGITDNAKSTVASVVEQLPDNIKKIVTETFENVKGSLKNERAPGKAALIGAGVAIATYIGFKMFGGSDKGEA